MRTRLKFGTATAAAILLFCIGQVNGQALNGCVDRTGNMRLLIGDFSTPCNPYAETAITLNAPAPGVCSDSNTKSYIMFPFLTNQSGFDTGLSVANTTSDPFGTTKTPGTCTLNFFGGTTAAPTTPPAPVTTPTIAAGAIYTTTLQTIAPNFQGYMIASCNFPLAHGFTFISDVGARNLAMGYLPFNICSPRVPPR